MNDRIEIVLRQFDGETLLSETNHVVHELPNDLANRINFDLVKAISGVFEELAEEKATASARTGENPFRR